MKKNKTSTGSNIDTAVPVNSSPITETFKTSEFATTEQKTTLILPIPKEVENEKAKLKDREKEGQNTTDKSEALRNFITDDEGKFLTTNQGVRISDDQNSLKVGERGPTLLEDFIMREKITHFDHERIPERVVHARGSGAHGFFQVYKSMAKYTKAKFLNDPTIKTPVFVRFSTVVGSRGSTDLARDVRGFAVKFYTNEGNYDLVGNNMPVFFIQDAMKFPDLIHAVKPEPHNEIPQAASAHTTFWDFISVFPESMHMIMWLMSDRAIPRSYRMMEGFGVNTFKLVNKEGKSFFVKFHWKPILGVHSVLWDEAQIISGKDPDFHRRDLWEAIDSGAYPEWELGVQIVEEKDEHNFAFDLLDPTKLIPEELVPVERIGKMILNRNPDNFFAEVEQSAFHLGNIVPGIDFSDDPLLQGRLFSYLDTQLIRLGGPNFHEIPINRPIAPIHNNQRDGFMRQMINKGKVSYGPNTLAGNYPKQSNSSTEGGFSTYQQVLNANKIRGRSESFFDHFSQATLFYHSQSEVEKKHIINAFCFELGKVDVLSVRERMVGLLTKVDKELAACVASGLGVKIPAISGSLPGELINFSVPADVYPMTYQPRSPMNNKKSVKISPALSMANTTKNTIVTRKIAFLATDGVNETFLKQMKHALEAEGAVVKIVSSNLGTIKCTNNTEINVDFTFLTSSSVFFDALYIPAGMKSADALAENPQALLFIAQAFEHCKPIVADNEGVNLIMASTIGEFIKSEDQKAEDKDARKEILAGILMNTDIEEEDACYSAKKFINLVSQHRFWSRESKFYPSKMED
ncbi:MAG: catalase [Oligoflexia bacterium]|nr:catalase [Oligoflexia bacterium]